MPKLIDYFDAETRERFAAFVAEQGGQVVSYTFRFREVEFCIRPPADADQTWLHTIFSRFEAADVRTPRLSRAV